MSGHDPIEPRRLSPLTPVVRGGVLVAAAAFASFDSLVSGEVGPFGIILLAVLLGGFVFGYASWLRTRYWITADELRIDTGVLYHQSRRIRIDRLQGIDIVQPFVARLVGLAELKIDVAGGDREGSLAYLPLAEAHQVREVLLARRDAVRRSAAPATGEPQTPSGVDPAWAPPEHEIARLDLPTLLLSMLLSMETVGVVVGGVVISVLALTAGGAVAIPILPVFAGFALIQVRKLSAYYAFTVSQTPAGLQVRRGLLERTTQTIALARVQGVLLSEPVLWRRMGWAKLDVAIAGYGGGGDADGGPSATTVMPVAPRGLVVQLARHLLGDDADPDAVPLAPPPRQARWLDPIARRFMGAGTSEDLVASREGWFTRRTHLVRHARVQSLRLTQGPLERWLGLADVHVDSPPGPVKVVARHRGVAEGRELLEREQALAESARTAAARYGRVVNEADPDPVPASTGSPDPEAASPPDVTVIIPVYNTMPYLTACLQSMVDQTIGPDRMEVVAVDDGSTDGSGDELERFAADHPALFTVLHQENSGGPAGPCNRGLEVARGRYVFFIGADDYLAENALEKLVSAADEWESDVIWGKVEGVGGRGISQLMFERTEKDIPFPHSRLPYALANSKMFRRSVIEEHGIRYALDLRVGSDQPFTVAAMLHARRISVLADQTYYYGVRRENATNITFSSGWQARIEDIGTVMAHIAELVPPGPERDQVLQRHFKWELANRLRADFLDLAEDDQRALMKLVAGLADEYFTEGVRAKLPVGARLRILLAQAGRLEELKAVVVAERDGRPAPVVTRDERLLLALPGYGDLPDDWFESRTENAVERLDAAVAVTSLSWRGPVLHVEAAGSGLHPDSAGSVVVELRALPGKRHPGPGTRRSDTSQSRRRAVLRSAAELVPAETVRGLATGRQLSMTGRQADEDGDAPAPMPGNRPTADGADLRATLDLRKLLGRAPGTPRRWTLRLVVQAGDRVFDLPLVADEGGPPDTDTLEWTADGWYRLRARVGAHRRLVVVRQPVPTEEVPRRDRLRSRVSRLRSR